MAKLNITINDDLLARAEKFAENQYMTKSGLVAVALREYLNAQELMPVLNSMKLAFDKIADSGELDEQTEKELDDMTRTVELLVSASKK